MEAYANAKREETLMVDVPNRFEGTDNWNPLVPGNATGFGLGQWGRTPLQLLSYGTGKVENYMAESFTANKDSTVWTLKLRPGITWSDGHALNADDIIYSIDIQKATKGLGQYGVYQEWIKEVKKIDDLTVEFTLNKANPRFPLERFSDMLCGYDWVVPKHVWEKAGDPLTFKNFDLKQGWPLTTGPYVLYKVTPNEAIWVRNDNWWAAKTGLKKLPEPKRIVKSVRRRRRSACGHRGRQRLRHHGRHHPQLLRGAEGQEQELAAVPAQTAIRLARSLRPHALDQQRGEAVG